MVGRYAHITPPGSRETASAPNGAHGIFAALPAGVVFALQGFEQAVQLAGEARDPKKDMSRAIIVAMTIVCTARIRILKSILFPPGRAHSENQTNSMAARNSAPPTSW